MSAWSWRFAHVLTAMTLGAALGACFNPPADPVLFACELEAAPACPPGYTCAADDCCHRDGSDVAANLGSCRIGGMPGTSSETNASSTGAAADPAVTDPSDAGATTSGATT